MEKVTVMETIVVMWFYAWGALTLATMLAVTAVEAVVSLGRGK